MLIYALKGHDMECIFSGIPMIFYNSSLLKRRRISGFRQFFPVAPFRSFRAV